MKIFHDKIAPRILTIVKEFKEVLISKLGQRIIKVVVYGSYATGSQKPESDLDILVVVKSKEIEKEIDDIAYKIMWEFDFAPLLSIYVVSEEHFNYIKKIRTGFYEAIEEGVEV